MKSLTTLLEITVSRPIKEPYFSHLVFSPIYWPTLGARHHLLVSLEFRASSLPGRHSSFAIANLNSSGSHQEGAETTCLFVRPLGYWSYRDVLWELPLCTS